MRRADLTKEESLVFWNKHKADIEETIKNKSNDCKCKLKFESGKNHTWTNVNRLEYVNKMIERINNTDYEFTFTYYDNEVLEQFTCYAKSKELAEQKYNTYLTENGLH